MAVQTPREILSRFEWLPGFGNSLTLSCTLQVVVAWVALFAQTETDRWAAGLGTNALVEGTFAELNTTGTG